MRLFASLILLLLFAGWSIAADKIILLVGEIPLCAEDVPVNALLEEMGFEVEPHSHDEPQPVDTSGAAAMVILASVSSGNITSAYKDVPVPIVTPEIFIFDEMQLAPDGSFTHDFDQTIVIVDTGHPITGGMTGEVEVASAPIDMMACSDLRGDVQIVANVLGTGNACIASYEKGAKAMDGSEVPARRVSVFPNTSALPLLTDDGWKLIENSILWALGELGMSVDSKGSVTATWGALKTYYH